MHSSHKEDIIKRCLDNTAKESNFTEQGLLYFGKEFFPKVLKHNYSVNHFKMSQLFLELLCPHRLSSMERQAYMLIHREAAKSTISSFLIPLYLIFLKGYTPVYRRMNLGWEGGDGVNNYDIVTTNTIDEKFILIASETMGQSEGFVMDIKSQIEDNTHLEAVFGSKHPEDIDQEDFGAKKRNKKWTRTAFITNDKTAVWGIGSGQRVRGRKINGSRPTTIIVDDMYSEENTKTPERREGLSQWFYNGLKNSADSEVGKILWLGTMVNPDIIVKDFQDDDLWFGIEKPIIGADELSEALDECSFADDGQLVLPNDDILNEMNNRFTTLSWKERYPIKYVLQKYGESIKKQKPDYFYQEYMNQPLAPESETIDPDAFERYKDIKFYVNEYGEQRCKYTDKNNIIWDGEVILKVGIDMASSLNKRNDDTAIIASGFGRFYPSIPGIDLSGSLTKYPKGVILPVLAHIEGGKYDLIGFDTNEAKKDISTQLMAVLKKFKIEKVVIEANGQQEQSIRAIKGYLRELGNEVPIIPAYVNVEKSQRIKSTLLPIFQKYKRMICVDDPKVTTLYKQLNMLTVSAHDDYPDALEKALLNARIPNENNRLLQNEIIEKRQMNRIEDILGKDAWYFI